MKSVNFSFKILCKISWVIFLDETQVNVSFWSPFNVIAVWKKQMFLREVFFLDYMVLLGRWGLKQT